MNIKKIFILKILTINMAFSMVFANELVSQSKIFPHFLTYDKDIKDKVFDNCINFVIIYDKFSQNSAEKLKDLILTEHSNKLNDYNLNVILSDTLESEVLKKASAVYLFDIDDNLINEITNFTIKNHIITFALNSNMLKKNITISLLIAKKVQPIINLKVLKDSNITLSHKIFKVCKVYE